jgi:hypothetical protein
MDGSFTESDNFNTRVDPRLLDILQQAAQRSGMTVQAYSGYRPGDPRFHGRGMATDIRLFGDDGKPIPNYQDARNFRTYEEFAQNARQVQQELYPDLDKSFRWGGYFSGGKGKYGALDLMHFDLGGERVPMGGGSWENGLTTAQRRIWQLAESRGMSGFTKTGAMPEAATPTAARGPMPASTVNALVDDILNRHQQQVDRQTQAVAPVNALIDNILQAHNGTVSQNAAAANGLTESPAAPPVIAPEQAPVAQPATQTPTSAAPAAAGGEITVDLPNGSTASFPASMSQDQIAEVLRKQFPAPTPPAAAASAPAAAAVAAGHAAANIPNILTAAGEYGVRQVGRALGLANPQQPGYSDILQRMNAEDEAIRAAHPVASAVGTTQGVLGTLGEATAPLLPGVAPAVGQLVKQGAAIGAGTGAVSGFGERGSLGDAALGAATGGVVGGALGPVAAAPVRQLAGGVAGGAIGAGIGGYAGYEKGGVPGAVAGVAVGGGIGAAAGVRASRSPWQLLGSKIQLPGETAAQAGARIEAARQQFVSVFQRNPSVAELLPIVNRNQQVGAGQARDLGHYIGSNPEATRIANAAEEASVAARPAEVQRAVQGGNPVMVEDQLSVAADNALTKALDAKLPSGTAVRDAPVPVDNLLSNNSTTRDQEIGLINTFLRGKGGGADVAFSNAVDQSGTLTVGQADEIRRIAGGLAQKAATGADYQMFSTLAARAQQAARNASPEYGAAFDAYVATKRRAEGAGVGAQGVTAPAAKFAAAQAELANRSGRNAGPAVNAVGPGLRSQLAERAGTGEAAATDVAKELSGTTGNQALATNMRTTLGQTETARLQEVGDLATRAATGVALASPRPVSEAAQSAKTAAETVRAGLIGAHGASTATLAHTLDFLLRKLALSGGAARRLATLAHDPQQVPAVVQYLMSRGASRREAHNLVSYWATAQAGNVAGKAVSQ